MRAPSGQRPPTAALWCGAVALALLAGGCGGPPPAGTAAPAAGLAPGVAAVPAAHVAQAAPAGRTPDVRDLAVEEAAAALGATGAEVRILVFEDGAPVSAQLPAPGDPLPPDTAVLLWAGMPPAPAPPSGAASAALPQPAAGTAGATSAEPSPQPTAPPADAGAPSAPPAAPPRTPATGSPAPPAGDDAAKEAAASFEGLASWYGPGFAGNRTACGDAFDPSALTLASRELPCGTRVRITGPAGRSVDATVTDWGPAPWTNRRFDLSAATFAAIADPAAGVVTVRLVVLG